MYIERASRPPLKRGEREKLNPRRPSEQFGFVFNRQSGGELTIEAGISRYADGRIAEVFLQTLKRSTDTEDDARDIAVLLSIAFQFGVPLKDIRDAVTRTDSGRAAGLAGELLDLLAGQAPL